MPPGEVWQEFRQKLDGHRREVLSLLRGMDEEAASDRPAGEWSVKQQVAHMCETEAGWLDWALTILREPGAEVGASQGSGQPFSGEVDGANDLPLWYWVTRLKASRSETLRRLLDAHPADEDLALTGRQRASGQSLSVLQALRALYRHDRMHAEQLQGMPSSFVPGSRAP